MQNPNEVLNYWLREVGSENWYKGGETLDREIRNRFETTWEAARDGKLTDWMMRPETILAYLILLDQFPRNMFRGTSKAFSTDRQARCAAKKAIDKKWDMRVDEPERQFFYLPLMHSECLCDQERCVRLMLTRMPESGELSLVHAKAHREVIRRFGRFPFRNEALSRNYTATETAFIEEGGYVSAVQEAQI